jgi:hypothetical protein
VVPAVGRRLPPRGRWARRAEVSGPVCGTRPTEQQPNRAGNRANSDLPYRDGATRRRRTCTVATTEFIRPFLQHVLPKGFVKVRYFGLFSPRQRRRLGQIHALLALARGTKDVVRWAVPPVTPARWQPPRCPNCGQPMLLHALPPQSRSPPPSVPVLVNTA